MMIRKKCFKTLVMLLSLVSIICLSACTERKARMAELLAMENPDSAASYLTTVDTTRMEEGERALYTLTRALVLEEKWQRTHADTAVCLHDNEDDWSFIRKSSEEKGALDKELDSIPMATLKKLLRVNQSELFTTSFPSKFDNVLDDFGADDIKALIRAYVRRTNSI